jgi:hypothetical protein
MTEPAVIWQPQPGPQTELLRCPTFEVLFGGARGGGKTSAMVGEWAQHAQMYGKDAIGRVFRNQREQLNEMIEYAKTVYLPIGAQWNEQKKNFTFRNGARIGYTYLESDSDAEGFQGHSYTRVYYEELTNAKDFNAVSKLKAALRSAQGVPCGFRATANPGGPSHQQVKARYIDPAPKGYKVIEEDGLDRVFIPSKVSDNKIMTDADPLYVNRLRQSGSAELVRRWLEGDWDVIEGAYFDNWSSARHVVRPVELPKHWTRFTSFDWGSAKPFSVGWWAVSDGTLKEFPSGALVRYREWYGSSAANVGIRMKSEAIAKGILEREGKPQERIHYRVADPACWKAEDGPSVAENMAQAGVPQIPGDNSRIMGWTQVRGRLDGEDGRPMLYVFSTCVDLIRTLPALQHDKHRPEDVDSSMEDHAGDECRLACMSRPWTSAPSERPKRVPYSGKPKQQRSGRWAA